MGDNGWVVMGDDVLVMDRGIMNCRFTLGLPPCLVTPLSKASAMAPEPPLGKSMTAFGWR